MTRSNSRLLLVAFLLLLAGAAAAETPPEEAPPPLQIPAGERLMVIAPHPDDETLGTGGLIQRVLRQRGRVQVVLLTAGDGYIEAVVHETGDLRPRASEFVAYGKRRLGEIRAALHTLAGSHTREQRVRLEFLGFPDGGLIGLLTRHWLRSEPARSRTTAASDPPYPDAVEPDVPYDGSDLRRELHRLIAKFRPSLIALPDPLDKHPDHRAAGLFALLALADWRPEAARLHAPDPRTLAYVVHWPDWPPGWNADHPIFDVGARLNLPIDLPPRMGAPVLLDLTPAEIEGKRAALERHATQQKEMPIFLATFVRRSEPFTLRLPMPAEHVGQLIQTRPTPTPRR